MSGFVLHPDALTDLNEIWEYIAADNPGAAGRGQVEAARGGVGDREALDVYAPDEKALLVLAILHGRRNPRVIAALLPDRE